jgi:hypothetical protein
METTSHNTNMNFNTFLKDTTLIILNRILAIITLLFVIASSVCLFLAHICVSVACYIEEYMLVGFGFSSDENGCLHHYIYHLNDIVRDKINLYIVKGDKVIIKEEIIEDEVEGYELDSDIEDVTEQVLQMKEKDKVTVDLTEEMLLEEYESDSDIEDVTDQLLETREEESVNVDLIEDDTEATIPQTNVVEDEESDERNSEDSNDLMTI